MDPNEKDWGDPAAAAMAWEPTDSGGGASFRTHALTDVSGDRWEFRATRGAKAFALAAAKLPIKTRVVSRSEEL